MVSNQQPLEKTALNIAGEKHKPINTMKKIYTTIAALLLVLCAVWNIRCDSEGTIETQRQQAAFLQYIHENSKPYKKSLKQDTLFAQRLDKVNKTVSKKSQNLYKKKK